MIAHVVQSAEKLHAVNTFPIARQTIIIVVAKAYCPSGYKRSIPFGQGKCYSCVKLVKDNSTLCAGISRIYYDPDCKSSGNYSGCCTADCATSEPCK